jgi:hypothetical protein
MIGINLSLGRLFKIWWAIQWRGALVGLLFCAVCYLLWQAFPWPALLSAWTPNLSIHAIAALAAVLIGIPFGLFTVRWFLHASFSDLQILTESQESREPPRFRIEPQIGNLVHPSFRTKPIPLERAVDTSTQVEALEYPRSQTVQRPKVQSGQQRSYARPH